MVVVQVQGAPQALFSSPHRFLVDHKSLTNPDTASRPQELCKTACNRHCLSLVPFLSIPSPPTFPFLSIGTTPVYIYPTPAGCGIKATITEKFIPSHLFMFQQSSVCAFPFLPLSFLSLLFFSLLSNLSRLSRVEQPCHVANLQLEPTLG